MATAAHLNHPGVQIFGGTVSVVAVGGVALSLAGSIAFVPAGSTITLTYAVAPTWTWFGLA